MLTLFAVSSSLADFRSLATIICLLRVMANDRRKSVISIDSILLSLIGLQQLAVNLRLIDVLQNQRHPCPVTFSLRNAEDRSSMISSISPMELWEMSPARNLIIGETVITNTNVSKR